jgi:hypothetical protein
MGTGRTSPQENLRKCCDPRPDPGRIYLKGKKEPIKLTLEKTLKGNSFNNWQAKGRRYLILRFFNERLAFALRSSFGKEHRLNMEIDLMCSNGKSSIVEERLYSFFFEKTKLRFFVFPLLLN